MSQQDVAVVPAASLAAWLRKELVPLLVLLLLMGAARDSLANHYQVPSGSMQPTLQPGDRVVVDMRAYGLRLPLLDVPVLPVGQPQRGDVAVFASPADGTRLIKRVVAVAGDRVELRGGHLILNDVALARGSGVEGFERKTVMLELDAGGGPDIASVVVPPGKLLVLGDHRGNSADGRYFGWVDADRVYGKAVAVYWRSGAGLQWQRL
jgi:signal peptidase I